MTTKRLIDLAVTTPWSLRSLQAVKEYYNLTDYGVEILTSYAAPRGIGLHEAMYGFLDANNAHTCGINLMKR